MRKMMKVLHFIVFIINIIVPVIIIIINMTYYRTIFQLSIVVSIPIFMSAGLITSRFKQLNKWRHRGMLTLSLISSLTIGLMFHIYKPNYTVNDSISKVIESSQIVDVHYKYNIQVTPKPNFFISGGYVLSGTLSNKEVEIIFDPVTGVYNIIK